MLLIIDREIGYAMADMTVHMEGSDILISPARLRVIF
jgi:hypothetical protein